VLGLKAPHPHLFEHVEWSTAAVAEQTRARARALGLPVVELEPWYDVDDASALYRLYRELTSPPVNGLAPFAAKATVDFIGRFDLEGLLTSAMPDGRGGVQ
jgi:uncharacterized protein